MWLLNSSNPVLRNIRSSIKLESWELFRYHINTGIIDIDSSKLKLSTTSQSISVYDKWWGYNRSQLLSLMLKSSVMISIRVKDNKLNNFYFSLWFLFLFYFGDLGLVLLWHQSLSHNHTIICHDGIWWKILERNNITIICLTHVDLIDNI